MQGAAHDLDDRAAEAKTDPTVRPGQPTPMDEATVHENRRCLAGRAAAAPPVNLARLTSRALTQSIRRRGWRVWVCHREVLVKESVNSPQAFRPEIDAT